MKRKIVCSWIIVFVLSLGLIGYNHQYHCYGYPFVAMPSGLSYKAIGKKSSGKKVEDGHWMEGFFRMQAIPKKKATGGNGKENIPINQQKFLCPFDRDFQSNCKAIAEMMGMMEEKQRMVFKCSPAYYWKDENTEQFDQILKYYKLNKEDTLLVDITLDKIMTPKEYSAMAAERRAAAQAKESEERAAQLAKDKQLIIDYLTTHGIKATSTDSGLFYIVDQPSEGISVKKGNSVKVHYTGKLLEDGTIFDTSVEEIAKANGLYDPQRVYKPFEFQVGKAHVIQGWEEGLLLLKKHEKARLFIPSALAYGPKGIPGAIPENAILLFEVEVVDLS